MERLKVLFLTNWYPTGREPTKAVWVREHARAAQTYADVTVLHCPGPDRALPRGHWLELETDEGLTAGTPTYRLGYRPSAVPGSSFPLYLWHLSRAFRAVVRRGFRPDILHAHVYDAGAAAVLIGRGHGIPVAVSEHFSSFLRRTLGRRDVWKAWLAFRGANVVLPVSHALRAAIESYGIRAAFRVIPNVADTAIFFPPGLARIQQGPKRILFVGQIAPVKGIPHLLSALARLAEKRGDWHLDVVGDGHARTQYEQMALELALGKRVTFHGLRTKPEVSEFMRRADLFVLPSLCETFSTPVAEALATGIPVLATRCGGPEEFVTEDVGVLVTPGDAQALRHGLDHMLDRLGRYSRQHIADSARSRFAPERIGAQLESVYRSLLGSRGVPGTC